jgi:predicted RND superfamily exporter protein
LWSKVNEVNLTSVLFGGPIDINKYLSPQRNADGQIIGAVATTMSWFSLINSSALSDQDLDAIEADGQAADATTLDFEGKFRDLFLDMTEEVVKPMGLDLFVSVTKGFVEVASEQMMNDTLLMPIGFTAVGIYVVFMLGHFTCVENRALLSGVGLVIIGLTILVTYGLCSAIGLFFGPMHYAIPFLFLGIGVDDMFVIMQSLDNLDEPQETKFQNIPRTIGQTMKYAGVAITVTSVTDIVVFAVGSSTVLFSDTF